MHYKTPPIHQSVKIVWNLLKFLETIYQNVQIWWEKGHLSHLIECLQSGVIRLKIISVQLDHPVCISKIMNSSQKFPIQNRNKTPNKRWKNASSPGMLWYITELLSTDTSPPSLATPVTGGKWFPPCVGLLTTPAIRDFFKNSTPVLIRV